MTTPTPDTRRSAARGPALLALLGGAGAALALAVFASGWGENREPAVAVAPAAEALPSVEVAASAGHGDLEGEDAARAPQRTATTKSPVDKRDAALAASIAAARERDSGQHLDPPSERELREAYLVHARQDAAGLEREADALLVSEAPDNQKVALLLALHEAGTPRSQELVLRALQDLPAEREGSRASVPEVLVRRLGQECGRDPSAARTLLTSLSIGTLSERPALRRRAVRGLAEHGTQDDLIHLEGILALEEDESVVEVARSALAARRNETNDRG